MPAVASDQCTLKVRREEEPESESVESEDVVYGEEAEEAARKIQAILRERATQIRVTN